MAMDMARLFFFFFTNVDWKHFYECALWNVSMPMTNILVPRSISSHLEILSELLRISLGPSPHWFGQSRHWGFESVRTNISASNAVSSDGKMQEQFCKQHPALVF